jgi:hypothetical protein
MYEAITFYRCEACKSVVDLRKIKPTFQNNQLVFKKCPICDHEAVLPVVIDNV